jgi:apolipoprotein D and lipocalin family protein
MRLCAILLSVALALAGCVPASAYRDPETVISSKAVLDLPRLGGDWSVVGYYPTPFEAGCDEIDLVLDLASFERTCRAQGVITRQDRAPLRAMDVARFQSRLDGIGPTPLWVLWVDDGYRTAVIGEPQGRFGWVINRDATIPRDRWVAAQRILDFNGYDPAALVRTGQ